MKFYINGLVLALTVSAWTLACKNDSASSNGAPQATASAKAEPPGGTHAAAGVTPGSHEDWCDEHQVPESQCTKCNPTLVAAFKATGDWCSEHGLPESQCRLCNPSLKLERPPKTAVAK
jgi:hypothetical protein